jgi:hypothetical protein
LILQVLDRNSRNCEKRSKLPDFCENAAFLLVFAGFQDYHSANAFPEEKLACLLPWFRDREAPALTRLHPVGG